MLRSNYLIDSWHSEHELQIAKLNDLRLDKALLDKYVEKFNFSTPYPFNIYIVGQRKL